MSAFHKAANTEQGSSLHAVEGLAKPGASHQARLRESRELGLEFVHSQGSMTGLISLTFDNPFTDERGK